MDDTVPDELSVRGQLRALKELHEEVRLRPREPLQGLPAGMSRSQNAPHAELSPLFVGWRADERFNPRYACCVCNTVGDRRKQGLLDEAVYLRQQEVLVAQLFGLPPPALRLADSADNAAPDKWREPVPQHALPKRGKEASATSDSDGDDDSRGVSGDNGLLPMPRARRKPRRRPADQKPDKASKASRRPRPGGRSKRSAGPPYRDDPIGPVGTPEPEPQTEPQPQPETEPQPEPQPASKIESEPQIHQHHTNTLGVCGVCGNVARACSCSRAEEQKTTTTAKTLTKKKTSKSKTRADEPPLAVATSEYDYDAPSGAYLSLSVGCEVSNLITALCSKSMHQNAAWMLDSRQTL